MERRFAGTVEEDVELSAKLTRELPGLLVCAVAGLQRLMARGRFVFPPSVEREYPHLKENMLSAMGNVDTGRLLDPRFLHLENDQPQELFPIVTEL